ncbi:transcriptional regulator [Sphingomonas aquatilis]|uniref:transcriptional regulator n=1 Tax=Sphingomonas aquatilis TaxID=93063 RepID=UPI0023F6E382|nr:YdaS family helix-turn-helix protein [Sphingomonas aquatilis]MCI4653101.1 helix-turn-helix domain-containing protein [Sphingomonas aquatilis]
MVCESAHPHLASIEEAVRQAGSQSALARRIGTSQATVWKWLNTGLPITPKLVLAIEAETGVSRHDLRPDLYPLEAPAVPDVPAGSEIAR